MSTISNCFLCKEKGLHSMGEGESIYQQCINCGYSTSIKWAGDRKTCKEFKNLSKEMKRWVKDANGHLWIPSIITLPFAMLYPVQKPPVPMKWALAEMVDIPEEEQKNYPIENGEGFYTKRFDTDNAEIYDEFIFAMAELNKRAKQRPTDA